MKKSFLVILLTLAIFYCLWGLAEGKIITKQEIIDFFIQPDPKSAGGTGEATIVFDLNQIPFDYDSSAINSRARAQLDEIGKALSSQILSYLEFEIGGHTDSRGTDEYNQVLSEKRAQSVVEYLIQNFNIKRERLKAKGYGESDPLVVGENEAAWEKNRRVEIKKLGRTPESGGIASGSLSLDLDFIFVKNEWRGSMYEGMILTEDDYYQVYFKPYQNCYVYIYQIDSAGTIDKLFPNSRFSSQGNPVVAGREYWIPGDVKDKLFFYLGGQSGEEKIYVLTSKEKAQDIEASFSAIATEPIQSAEKADELIGKIALRSAKGVRTTKPKNLEKPPVLPPEMVTDTKDFFVIFTFQHE
ncbi:MAG: OmpA family protein [Candidatus Atribacteria bacterium]|nr:OmpA family protein [Candidatus Atribacteria bacterium]